MAEKPKIRVFLDSNAIFSGLRSGEGPPGTILERAAEGKFRMVISRQVLDEVVRTIAEKLPDALPYLWIFLTNIPIEVCRDPEPQDIEAWVEITGLEDAPIAAAAEAAEVNFLVSGDGHFLRAKAAAERKGLRVVSPSDFLEAIKRGCTIDGQAP